MKFEIKFSEGIPDRPATICGVIIYPEELLDKKCGGCVRCEPRDHGDKGGWHCTMQKWDKDVFPTDKACVHYWDQEKQDELDRLHEEDIEKRRQELWAIYSEKPPIKLPIVNYDYGTIPMCPVCGEMPYSTEQCHWCGQRFIQDEEVTDWSTPKTEDIECPNCGKPGKAKVSKYNGHRHFQCEYCGFGFME